MGASQQPGEGEDESETFSPSECPIHFCQAAPNQSQPISSSFHRAKCLKFQTSEVTSQLEKSTKANSCPDFAFLIWFTSLSADFVQDKHALQVKCTSPTLQEERREDMAVKVKPVGAAVSAKGGQRMVAQVKPNEEVICKAEIQPWFKKKKASVIPPKRRLVKRKMFDLLVEFMASLCCSGASTSEDAHVAIFGP